MTHTVAITVCGLIGAFTIGSRVAGWVVGSDGLASMVGLLAAGAWMLYIVWICLFDDV